MEGATHSYGWNGLQEGMEYEFYLSSNSDGSGVYDDELTTEFDFVNNNTGEIETGENTAFVNISWNEGASANSYYLWINVTDPDGCSNYSYVRITPQPNNRTIGFDLNAGADCFNPEGNTFETTFSVLGNNGEPLPAEYYPLELNFTVNGNPHNLTVEANNNILQIEEDWFSANPEQNTNVVVEITAVTDKYNAGIQTENGRGTFTKTLYAIPVIEFTDVANNGN